MRPTPAPRWPLKPGVLVHVNRTHSLRSGSSVLAATDAIARTSALTFRRGKEATEQRRSSMSGMHEESMLSRANRIRAMFGAQPKEPDSLPGISREKTAMTYKRIAPHQRTLHNVPSPTNPSSCNINVSRKRKKPGADPNQAANNNHVDSVSESLPEPETKTFYENLPFHGIQTPPDKLVSPKFARISALHGTLHSATNSSCSSPLLSGSVSLCGASSGYESARSHLGPHYGVHNMPRSNSPEPKCSTLKPRRRKQKHTQFYSLRLCRRHRTTHRNYQLYAVPICKGCPHKSGGSRSSSSTTTTSTIGAASARSTEDAEDPPTPTPTPTPPIASTPPTPAPRTGKTNPLEHDYQNILPPVFPQKSSATAIAIETNDLYDYQQQELQQYGYLIPSNGSSQQLTLPLTRGFRQSYSVISPSQTTFVPTTNNRHSMPADDRNSNVPLSLVHGDVDLDLTRDHRTRQRSELGGRRHERGRKYRKDERNGQKKKKKKKQQQRHVDRRRSDASYYETIRSDRLAESGIPESYKISYPHYYEDAIIDANDSRSNEDRAHDRDRNTNRRHGGSLHYADLNLTKSRGKARRCSTSLLDRSPSAQYAELRFRDVGREIDV